jgi:hypothetical protein
VEKIFNGLITSKKVNSEQSFKYSHYFTIIMPGLIMGDGAFELLFWLLLAEKQENSKKKKR